MASKFDNVLAAAQVNKGGAQGLEQLLPKVKSANALMKISDDRYLAEMSKCVFRAGFVWRVVEHKWPGFEQVFAKFNPGWIAMQPAEKLEEIAQDKRIIRNYTKVKSVYSNALFIRDVSVQHGSFGRFMAAWPGEDIIGLWTYLKKHASRLGGASGPYFLRFVGKDTFLLTDDVVAALVNYSFTTQTKFTSQKALQEVQGVFNELREETGRSHAQLSRILACSV